MDGTDQNRSVALQLWAIGAVFPLIIAANADFLALDFGPLWLAGKQVLSGHASSIYNSAAGPETVFPYPPHAVLLFVPFALLPKVVAAAMWNVASIAFFYWAAKPYLPKGLPPLLPVLTPAAIICLTFGQTGLLLGGLWLLAFRGRWAAVALLTFKPHLGVLSILSIKSKADLAKTVLLVLAMLTLTILLFGPSLWQSFAEHSFGHGARIGANKRWLFAGVSPAMAYGLVAWIPFAVAAGIILARNVNVFTASTASFLISPYGFHYDMPAACLGFGLVIYASWHDMPIRDRIPMAIGFLAPVIAISGAWWMPPLLIWALWAQTKYAVPNSPAAVEHSSLDRGSTTAGI